MFVVRMVVSMLVTMVSIPIPVPLPTARSRRPVMVMEPVLVRAALDVEVDGSACSHAATTTSSTGQGKWWRQNALLGTTHAGPLADGTERYGIGGRPLRRLQITRRTVLVGAFGAFVRGRCNKSRGGQWGGAVGVIRDRESDKKGEEKQAEHNY